MEDEFNADLFLHFPSYTLDKAEIEFVIHKAKMIVREAGVMMLALFLKVIEDLEANQVNTHFFEGLDENRDNEILTDFV